MLAEGNRDAGFAAVRSIQAPLLVEQEILIGYPQILSDTFTWPEPFRPRLQKNVAIIFQEARENSPL